MTLALPEVEGTSLHSKEETSFIQPAENDHTKNRKHEGTLIDHGCLFR